ncbi:MAG: Lrp/AsnC family transcriptional regulator [Actinomycetota bacterium]
MDSQLNVRADVDLDEIDRTIVDVLRIDGRISIPALAERVGIGRATAYARFDRLMDAGVIRGFEARVAADALGLGVSALVVIEAEQVAWADLRDRVMALSSVHWVGLTAGASDFVVLVRAGDLDELRDVVLRDLLSVPGIRNTQTSVLLEEARPEGSLL